jgi:hypothetical protein
MSDASLPGLFKRSLAASSKCANLPTVDDETQVASSSVHPRSRRKPFAVTEVPW